MAKERDNANSLHMLFPQLIQKKQSNMIIIKIFLLIINSLFTAVCCCTLNGSLAFDVTFKEQKSTNTWEFRTLFMDGKCARRAKGKKKCFRREASHIIRDIKEERSVIGYVCNETFDLIRWDFIGLQIFVLHKFCFFKIEKSF